MVLSKKLMKKGSDQTVQMRKLVCAFFVLKPPKTCFSRLGPHRESYMSTPVLLNLLNELGKRDQMRGLDPN